MQTKIFRLGWEDLVKGLVITVLGAVLGSVQQAIATSGFDFAFWDWQTIINLAVTTGIAYLAKNLLTNEDGKFLGKI